MLPTFDWINVLKSAGRLALKTLGSRLAFLIVFVTAISTAWGILALNQKVPNILPNIPTVSSFIHLDEVNHSVFIFAGWLIGADVALSVIDKIITFINFLLASGPAFVVSVVAAYLIYSAANSGYTDLKDKTS